MPVDLVVLKTELQTDPTGLGYSIVDLAASHALLNELRVSIQIAQQMLPATDIIDATVFSELAATSATEQRMYIALTGAGEVNVESANVRAAFMAIFPSGSTTRANLGALQSRDGSRAEELFGEAVSLREVEGAFL